MINIINDPEQVSIYKENINARADSNKKSLGFLPFPVYEEMIHQGKVFAAIEETITKKSCIGHLIFGGKFPNMRIYQVAVDKSHARKGIGKKLVKAAIDHAKKRNYQNLIARVGATLDANKFWKTMGFALFHKKHGGQTHPLINIRVNEIKEIPLFPSIDTQISNIDILSIVDSMQYDTSRCFLDVNIILDMIKEREGSKHAKYILNDMKKPYYDFFISPEVIKELEHHANPEDNALNLAKQIPQLPESENEDLKNALLALVFPNQTKQEKIIENHLSDAQHLATAIDNKIDNFVTRDKGILRNRDVILKKHNLHVMSSDELYIESELQSPNYNYHPIHIGKNKITIQKNIAHDIIAPLISDSEMAKWGKHDSRHIKNYVIYSQNNIIGFSLLRPYRKGLIENIDMLVGICDNGHKYESDILHFFLEWLFSFARQHNIADIQLTLQDCSIQASKILPEHGYSRFADSQYRKILISQIITSDNWSKYKHTLQDAFNICLPNTPPDFTTYSQQIPIQNNKKVSMDKLESFISSIFLLPNRDGVIVPIKKGFAQMLFRHSKQISLLPSNYDTPLSWKKSYFSSPRSKKILTTGSPLLFYESNKVGVIAIARIIGSYLVDKQDFKDVSHQGVLTDNEFDDISRGKVCLETVFDSPIVFPKPVSFQSLVSMGADDGAHFVSASRIKYDIIQKIIKKGGVV